jgi:hypothetical protein
MPFGTVRKRKIAATGRSAERDCSAADGRPPANGSGKARTAVPAYHRDAEFRHICVVMMAQRSGALLPQLPGPL